MIESKFNADLIIDEGKMLHLDNDQSKFIINP